MNYRGVDYGDVEYNPYHLYNEEDDINDSHTDLESAPGEVSGANVFFFFIQLSCIIPRKKLSKTSSYTRYKYISSAVRI